MFFSWTEAGQQVQFASSPQCISSWAVSWCQTDWLTDWWMSKYQGITLNDDRIVALWGINEMFNGCLFPRINSNSKRPPNQSVNPRFVFIVGSRWRFLSRVDGCLGRWHHHCLLDSSIHPVHHRSSCTHWIVNDMDDKWSHMLINSNQVQ